MSSIPSPLDPVVTWFILVIAGKAVFALFGWVTTLTAPVRRPLWAVFMRANWAWPAAVLLALGIASGVVGGMLLQKPNSSDWEMGFGLALFFGGAFVAVAGPAFWFDERRRLGSQTALTPNNQLPNERCSRRPRVSRWVSRHTPSASQHSMEIRRIR
jgi:hypothetical protein